MRTYEKIMQTMTPEVMAELGVKLINVDNRRLFYVTSSGQLYPIEHYNEAVAHEYNWLMADDGIHNGGDKESVKDDVEKDGENS